jgi:eukaryotic-like serine/threonine-protein kinase
MVLASGTRLGPYEILGVLGAGGMGQVYRARDTRLHRDVAIKVLPPDVEADAEHLSRFRHEAIAAGALNHRNLLVVHDVGSESDRPRSTS